MADNIGTAYVQIEPSFEGVTDKIEGHFSGEGEKAGKSFGSGFGSVAGTVGKAMAGAVATAGAAIGAMGTKFVNASAEVASYGDNIDKMSQKMGLSASAYQEWDAVMQHSGTSIDSMMMGIKTLNNNLSDSMSVITETIAADTELEELYSSGAISMDEYNKRYDELYDKAYKDIGPLSELGLSMNDMMDMAEDSDLALETVITKLQDMPDGIEKTTLAQELLGRSAMEMGALLNTSSEETQEMRDRVRELGGVMSDDAVKASAAFQDQLQDMQTSFQGLSRNMMAEFLPSLTQVMSGLTEIFSGNIDEGLAQITDGINGLVDGITQALPEIAKVATSIIEALGTAIIENLPLLIDAGMDIVTELCTFIVENLPMLIDAGLEIILELAMGIAQSLPELIPAIVETILTIVEYLIDNIDLLIDASIAIIMGLAEGLIKALPRLIEKAPEIIMKLTDALIRNAPKIAEAAVKLISMLVEGIVKLFGKIIEVGGKLVTQIKEGFSQKVEDAKNWGKDIINNFINGIKEKWEHLKQTVKDVAGTISSYLHFSEPDEGPLSNFHTYAPDMMDLFAKGIRENIGTVKQALNDATSDVMSTGLDVETAQNVQMSVNSAVASSGNGNMGRIESLLLEVIDKLQIPIVMDTGALVGATAGAYNVALGQIATRGGRR